MFIPVITPTASGVRLTIQARELRREPVQRLTVMRIAVHKTPPGIARSLAPAAIPLAQRGLITIITPIATATFTGTPVVVGTSTITAVGIACRTTPGGSLSITTRPLASRATSALLLLLGDREAGAAVSAV